MRSQFFPRLLPSVFAALALVCAAAQAVPAPAAASAPPAGFAAPAELPSEETNAQRAKSQPGNNAPFWRAVQRSGVEHGISSVQGTETGVLVQAFVQYPGSRGTNAGDAWREVRNDWIIPYGGSLLVIAVLAVALYYVARGPIGGHIPNTGRKIERFTYFERAAHWSNATAFSVLAVSGLVMAFGKFWLPQLIGGSMFGGLTYGLKTAHNFAGPLFAVSLLIVFVVFLRDNFPGRGDLQWLLKGGGMFGGAEPASGRFNVGEKIIFWGGVFVLGGIVVGSGLVLDQLIPGVTYLRRDLQIANMVHGVATVLMMAMFIGHIYLGTIGMKGAYRAMQTGYVDASWAEEHHALWLEDIEAGRVPAHRTPLRKRGPSRKTECC